MIYRSRYLIRQEQLRPRELANVSESVSYLSTSCSGINGKRADKRRIIRVVDSKYRKCIGLFEEAYRLRFVADTRASRHDKLIRTIFIAIARAIYHTFARVTSCRYVK